MYMHLHISITGGESASSILLRDLGEEYWMWRMREFPIWATYRGIHDFDDTLEEYTEEAFLRRKVDSYHIRVST